MISKLAYTHPEAKVGEHTQIDAFSSIYHDVEIGVNTWIAPNVTIFPGTRIGSGCKIFPGAVIGAEPQDLKFNGEYSTVEIGDGTVVRECVTIHRATKDKCVTKVGKNCLLMAYSHVAHDVLIGDHCVLANQVSIAGHVEIGDWAILEGLVAVQQFIKIGAHAFIAGATLVRKDVPPYVKAAREPISYIGVNSIGLKRRGFEEQTIRDIEDVYRLIFVQNQNITIAMTLAENELKESEIKSEIFDFIRSSPKGIMKGIY